MATTNYSLPTLESTALFDLVTDYNALANATDAAVAKVAGLIPTKTIAEMQGQISALQTLTGSQNTQITTLQSQMTAANSNISTLKSGLETANRNIGTWQTKLQDTNTKVASCQTKLQDTNNNVSKINGKFTFTSHRYNTTEIFDSVGTFGKMYLMKNTDETIIKFFGDLSCSKSTPKVLVPGLTGVYGIKSKIKAINRTLTSGYFCNYTGVSIAASGGSFSSSAGFAIGSDGYIYLYAIESSNNQSPQYLTEFMQCEIYLGTPLTY